MNAAKRSPAQGMNRRPPNAERTPRNTSALTTDYPAANHAKRARDTLAPHGHRRLPLSGADREPYAGAVGQPAGNGIWRRTALPACYPIMGLVNRIRDTRVATVESPHAEPGSNRAPSLGMFGDRRAVPQLVKSSLKTSSKVSVSYVGWRSARPVEACAGCSVVARAPPGHRRGTCEWWGRRRRVEGCAPAATERDPSPTINRVAKVTSWFMSASWFRPAGSARARTMPRRAGAGCAGRAWWPWLGRGSPAVRAGSPGARSGQ